MSRFQIAAHEVEVTKIAAIEMLIEHSRIISPETGLILRLDDGARHVWGAAKNEAMPLVGDALVSDPDLQLTFVVPASRFSELFTEV